MVFVCFQKNGFCKGMLAVLLKAAAISEEIRHSYCQQEECRLLSGSPEVMVPVLSRATISTLPFRETAVLNRIPFLAPMPFPTMMATGVASPRAQGQLMTRTEIPRARANPMVCPARSHQRIGDNCQSDDGGNENAGYLVCNFGDGSFGGCGIADHLDDLGKGGAFTNTKVLAFREIPDWLMVAAETGSPTALSTGILSPVRADSFTALAPSRTNPSTGMFSPGRTTKMSSFFTCSMGTVIFLSVPENHSGLGGQFHQSF